MNRLFQSLTMATGLMIASSVCAQGDDVKANVELSIDRNQEIWMGQQVTLNLDLKTTGFSFSDTHFNLPEVSGAFLMQTDTTTIKLTEKIGGVDWQIVRYPFALYPQKAGRLEIPPIDVRFNTSAGFGSTQKAFEFQTSPLELSIALPPGVKEGDLVVSTSSFALDYNWQPTTGTAGPGDAFTLTVTRRADDISAMLLPPLPVFRNAGLAAYPQAPEINDKTNRGDLTGERIDKIIWVAEKPGQFDIPGIRFQWWDPLKRELEQQIVPGLSLDVLSSPSDGPVSATPGEPAQGSRNQLRVLLLVLVVFLSGVGWWQFRRKTQNRHPVTEKTAFADLQKACESNQAAATYAAIHAWLVFSSPANAMYSRSLTLGKFARIHKNEALTAELERLQEALVLEDKNWQGVKLLGSLQRVRRKLNKHETVRSKAPLAPLNP